MKPDLPFNCPVARERVASMLERAPLGETDRLLDVGCGTGEMLALALELSPASGVGVDPDRSAMQSAARRLAFAEGRVTLITEKIADADLGTEAFHFAMCVGSTHAFGGVGEAYEATLAGLTGFVRPGGLLLVGDGYWKVDPAEDYLRASGIVRQELVSHEENLARAERHGLELVQASKCSQEEWDAFEDAFLARAETLHRIKPHDEESIQRVEKVRAWNAAWNRWGRETFGFALYLFRRPAS